MDAKTYLRQLQYLDKRINALLERRERYEALATKRTMVYSGGMPGSQRRDSSVETYACKLVDLAREIDRRIDEYVDLTREAERLIECVSDGRYRDILTYRYLNYWGWTRIAEGLNHTSIKAIWNLHSMALREFTSVLRYYDTSAKIGD